MDAGLLPAIFHEWPAIVPAQKTCAGLLLRVWNLAFLTSQFMHFPPKTGGRPQDEVSGLMQILADSLENEIGELHKQGVRLNHIGRLEHLDKEIAKKIKQAIELTKDNERLVLNIAWNYGGRDEIVHAVQEIIKEGLSAESISEETISSHLFLKGIPDPDLVIRTSGEQRASNFLIWQSAYSEWYFTPTLWPDFDKEALQEAIEDFGQRDRRFGGRNTTEKKEKYAG